MLCYEMSALVLQQLQPIYLLINLKSKILKDDTLIGRTSSVDVSTKKNLQNLVQIDEDLLKKPVSRLILETGQYAAS
ncbi:uncharacterized protein A4U43_C05F34930 [Asparagus officinalis]|uniref:Uncharacterized protein n=1 Tax=Asparagus officinalis TaxID=4686 RepID=A0A5P1EWY5_ASPOF|nr:uncharacterized protein A4U43_C05F34930 [Asparagus officinalis]